MNNIHIIGTSHVSPESIKEVEQYILEKQPDIVCVELDKGRLEALLEDRKPSYSPSLIFKIGVAGYIFATFGGIVQASLGKKIGTKPGHDMLSAVKAAKQVHKKVAVIDQPIQRTLKKLSKAFTFIEFCKVIGDFLGAVFRPKKTQKELGLKENVDITKVPKQELIDGLILHLKKRYLAIYNVILHERNIYMVRKLIRIQNTYPDVQILAVVGAAHVTGMKEILEKQTVY